MEGLWYKIKFLLIRFSSFEKKGRFIRYSIPLVSILLIPLVIQFIPEAYFHIVQRQTIAFLLLIFIVTISAWFGGLGPGILATCLTAVINYLTILQEKPTHSFETHDLIIITLLLGIGFIISIISEARYELQVQKNEFLGLTAHELKNPICSIKAFAELIARQTQKITPFKLETYAENIQTQSEKLLELIDDLLDITRIEIGKFAYNIEPFNFDLMVTQTITHLRVINKERVITLSGQSKMTIQGDQYRIKQVITNLISNAIKYSPKKSRIEVKLKKTQRAIILQVKDHGIGIPPADQKKIFSRFFRTRNAEGGKTEGLGLGLYISSQIARYHNGKLWVKSKAGHGSTFFFKLPNGYKH